MTAPRASSVLIVEDERIVAMDLQQMLSGLGYDTSAIASSAEEAIARASQRCPDVVLMDIRIKGRRDGIETAELLKRQFRVPVVYLTAHADDATLERAKKTEPHAYLIKPVKPADLHSAIEVCLYRHEMEKRLRERERWYSTTLRSIADAVLTVDLSGKVTFMNPAAEALIGIAAADAFGAHAHDVVRRASGQDEATPDAPLAIALREQRTVELQEASLLNLATGVRHLISDSAAPVIDEGQPLGAVMVFRDVTEQKRAQRHLELSDRLISLGTMAAGVAHEINNPLSVILGNTGFVAEELAQHRVQLKEGALPSVVNRRLDEVAAALLDLGSAASRIARVASDLQAFTRPVQQSPRTCDVARCISWAIRTTAHELRHRATLVTRLGEAPAASADETRLGQVFVNLLVNAAHAIAPGNAEQNEVSITLRTDDLGWIVVEVADTGSGIPGPLLGQIFEPFFTTKEVGKGTGLGLSICHGIVASLGGELSVESEVGTGTTFLVRLPPAQYAEVQAEAATQRPPLPLRGRIMVVDDEDLVLRTVVRILQDYDVVSTDNVRDALAIIERGEHFDLILSDLMMPTMSGMDFYEALLGRDPALARRVVFLSGGVVTAATADFLRSVPNLFIAKPFTVASLLDTVQQLLEAQRAAQ